MQLANDLKRALGKRKAFPYKANGYAVGIKQGKIRLLHLRLLAEQAKCSLTYLTSGGCYEAKEDLPPKEAIRRSIMHKGYDKHDFARKLGYRNFTYLSSMLEHETIPVKILMKMAEALEMEARTVTCRLSACGDRYEIERTVGRGNVNKIRVGHMDD